MASMTEILILHGLLPIEQLEAAHRSADEEASVRELLERGVVTDAQVASARAAQAGLPFVELVDFPVDRAAVALVPAHVCRRHDVLPIVGGGHLILAMADPGNVFAIDDVRASPHAGAERRRREPTSARRSTATSAPTASSTT